MKTGVTLLLGLILAVSLVSAGCPYEQKYEKYDKKYYNYKWNKGNWGEYDNWDYELKYKKYSYKWEDYRYKNYDWKEQYYEKKYRYVGEPRYDNNFDRVFNALWYGDPKAKRVLQESMEDQEGHRCKEYRGRCWYY